MKIKCGEAITFIISLCNRLSAAGVNIEVVSHLLVGLDWIFLATIGGFIGEGINVLGVKNQVQPAARENKKIG
ncbi:hypothetical protein BTI679_19950 [Bacillus wiedmannii]|nr:hypothetical protein [Bacillus wiedmannii]MBG9831806.1 hypothetical protein [Bacillus wiedmannii]UOB94661.1 hypothetical protein BTI679_19950 [Bacillus wiedmannii]